MADFGYHRISTTNQHEDRGLIEISRFCEERGITLQNEIFVDKITGKKFDRPHYTTLKECILRPGDRLIITELDRLGRNKQQILKELQYFRDKGVRVMILEVPTTTIELDVSSPMYKLIYECIQNLVIEVFCVFCELELEKRSKRQKEGLEALRLRGEWDKMGRPVACAPEKFSETFERVLQGALRPFEAIKELEISVPTYYRYKKQYEQEHPKTVVSS